MQSPVSQSELQDAELANGCLEGLPMKCLEQWAAQAQVGGTRALNCKLKTQRVKSWWLLDEFCYEAGKQRQSGMEALPAPDRTCIAFEWR